MKFFRDKHPMPEPTNRRLIRQADERPSWLPIGTRCVALLILAGGAMLTMSSIQSARGQYPQNNPNFRNGSFSPLSQNNSNPQVGFRNRGSQSSIPTIPSAAIPGQSAAAPGQTEQLPSEDFASSWQVPAFVQKITQGGWLMIPLGNLLVDRVDIVL